MASTGDSRQEYFGMCHCGMKIIACLLLNSQEMCCKFSGSTKLTFLRLHQVVLSENPAAFQTSCVSVVWEYFMQTKTTVYCIIPKSCTTVWHLHRQHTCTYPQLLLLLKWSSSPFAFISISLSCNWINIL